MPLGKKITTLRALIHAKRRGCNLALLWLIVSTLITSAIAHLLCYSHMVCAVFLLCRKRNILQRLLFTTCVASTSSGCVPRYSPQSSLELTVMKCLYSAAHASKCLSKSYLFLTRKNYQPSLPLNRTLFGQRKGKIEHITKSNLGQIS